VAKLNAITQGDSLEKLQAIPPQSVDLVFADPPFNIGYKYDVYRDDLSKNDYLDWSSKWMAGVSKVLKPNGTFWLAIGDEYAAELKLVAQNDCGFSCRSWVIWYYTFGVNCVRGFSRSHTHLFHFTKDPHDFTFNAENPSVRVLSARQLVYGDLRANPRGRLPDNTWILRPQDAPPHAFVPAHDTWYYARVAGTFKEREGFHGCQMPEQLLARIIRISSNPTEVVLDPFSGSGTTLVVAKKLGRQWMGIELSKEYVSRIKQRLSRTNVGDDLDGPADPILSAPTTAGGKSNITVRNGRSLPHADEKTEQGVIDAFHKSSSGISTDFLLCDPEANARFVASCEGQGLAGRPFVWNRLLLRIRKMGKLPKGNESSRRIPFRAMDRYSFASEIAMQLVGLDHGVKLDDILCDPETASLFDRIASELAPGFTPFDYRWAALAIRKRAKKSNELADTEFKKWIDKPLPKSIPLADDRVKSYDGAAVYIVSQQDLPLYVGETYNLRSRLDFIDQSERWRILEPTELRVIRATDSGRQHGLQALLVRRLNPLLNSQLLRRDIERIEPLVGAHEQ
jgi:site-specific DNA-methyltransferase (adenine-specific)